ncbi:MAG: metallophosphoesterase [Gammaproteobacteria bacterium]|jgi:putative phosphoesterase|nr:metallophosphoesterase [Gammaproteobacteria bacterium]
MDARRRAAIGSLATAASERGAVGDSGRSPVRVALVADTHGFLDPRIAAIVSGCDIALHGGDIGNAEVLAQLQPRGGHVYAVLGNNDVAHKWPDGQRELLVSIPWEAHVALPGGELVLLHGHRVAAARRHQRLRARFPHARAICYGHSHRMVDDRDALPWVLNPGAAGRARTYGGPSCMVLIASEAGWQVEPHRFLPRSGNRRLGASSGQDAEAVGRRAVGGH